ncbi:hypothetical protein BU14_0099s0022 [Porphyra umbilicalis]|uniref:BHLH domain-containing protein n=1 Tax=Porphyra umbilicalis TaxID=2786 RepID=A0A1X6PD09_PORUM|nr:hypothetical protein BU14_0099s0022 [Porphyra umbilicalis]|eukprot:OSX78757.1 hypothetical protein BU14_0099s0022 [Porphyra umbilicalis]
MPMTRLSAMACTGGEVAGHPAAAHARGGKGSSSRPSPSPPPTGAAATARVETVAKDAQAETARYSVKPSLAGGHLFASDSQSSKSRRFALAASLVTLQRKSKTSSSGCSASVDALRWRLGCTQKSPSNAAFDGRCSPMHARCMLDAISCRADDGEQLATADGNRTNQPGIRREGERRRARASGGWSVGGAEQTRGKTRVGASRQASLAGTPRVVLGPLLYGVTAPCCCSSSRRTCWGARAHTRHGGDVTGGGGGGSGATPTTTGCCAWRLPVTRLLGTPAVAHGPLRFWCGSRFPRAQPSTHAAPWRSATPLLGAIGLSCRACERELSGPLAARTARCSGVPCWERCWCRRCLRVPLSRRSRLPNRASAGARVALVTHTRRAHCWCRPLPPSSPTGAPARVHRGRRRARVPRPADRHAAVGVGAHRSAHAPALAGPAVPARPAPDTGAVWGWVAASAEWEGRRRRRWRRRYQRRSCTPPHAHGRRWSAGGGVWLLAYTRGGRRTCGGRRARQWRVVHARRAAGELLLESRLAVTAASGAAAPRRRTRRPRRRRCGRCGRCRCCLCGSGARQPRDCPDGGPRNPPPPICPRTGAACPAPSERKRELERKRRELISERLLELEAAVGLRPSDADRAGKRIDKEAVLKAALGLVRGHKDSLAGMTATADRAIREAGELRAEKAELRADKAYLRRELDTVREEARRLRADNIALWKTCRARRGATGAAPPRGHWAATLLPPPPSLGASRPWCRPTWPLPRRRRLTACLPAALAAASAVSRVAAGGSTTQRRPPPRRTQSPSFLRTTWCPQSWGLMQRTTTWAPTLRTAHEALGDAEVRGGPCCKVGGVTLGGGGALTTLVSPRRRCRRAGEGIRPAARAGAERWGCRDAPVQRWLLETTSLPPAWRGVGSLWLPLRPWRSLPASVTASTLEPLGLGKRLFPHGRWRRLLPHFVQHNWCPFPCPMYTFFAIGLLPTRPRATSQTNPVVASYMAPTTTTSPHRHPPRSPPTVDRTCAAATASATARPAGACTPAAPPTAAAPPPPPPPHGGHVRQEHVAEHRRPRRRLVSVGSRLGGGGGNGGGRHPAPRVAEDNDEAGARGGRGRNRRRAAATRLHVRAEGAHVDELPGGGPKHRVGDGGSVSARDDDRAGGGIGGPTGAHAVGLVGDAETLLTWSTATIPARADPRRPVTPAHAGGVPDEGHQRPCRRYVAVPLATAPPRSRSGSRPCADKIVLVGRRHSGGLVGHYRPSVSALRVFIGFAALHCSPPVSFTFDSLQAKP